ncbi:hypothetical protein L915_09639 [Phytophthora nicotianae]|uniref:Uncharacterized protein n=1 Tax=Phytophthora nicotianae TaxID=4792 RepID=W2GRI5_PHYNI|nr:hypothetical protein L915_09639 [Phytophthora nicotianae]
MAERCCLVNAASSTEERHPCALLTAENRVSAVTSTNTTVTNDQCTGVVRTVKGCPCVHELIQITKSNGQTVLTPNQFDLHWRINRDQA